MKKGVPPVVRPYSSSDFSSRAPSLVMIETLKQRGSQERDAALARFCTEYYPQVLNLAREQGLDAGTARARTQEFLTGMAREGRWERFDPTEGRCLGEWVMECFQVFLADKRGRAAWHDGAGLNGVKPPAPGLPEPERVQKKGDLPPVKSGPDFDLALAREIWSAARVYMVRKHQSSAHAGLAAELAPHLLEEGWPAPPAPSLEALARRHGMAPSRLRVFFGRTLKRRARCAFDEVAMNDSPGIREEELDHLWHMLRRYGDAP